MIQAFSSQSTDVGDSSPGRFGLAPMEGVSEFPMRLWMHLTSAPDFCVTPFLRVTPTFPARAVPERFAPELMQLQGHLPYKLLPQMMAAKSEDFIRVAAFFLAVSPNVELNCGCPAPCSVGSGAGSSLLQDPKVFAGMLQSITQALGPHRLAVKMRTGFTNASSFDELLTALPGEQLARLTVHGRSRSDRYTGKARWDLIQRASVIWPQLRVVGSGDIVDHTSYQQALKQAPQVRTMLIGRGALRNPWIFSELRQSSPQATTLSTASLLLALAVHVLLHELDLTASHKLYDLLSQGHLLQSCGTDQKRWEEAYGHLSSIAWAQLDVSRIALGRLKMEWSSLRSSLPTVFFEPKLLRSKTAGELLTGINSIATQNGYEHVTLRYQPTHDWIYAGEKNPESQVTPEVETAIPR